MFKYQKTGYFNASWFNNFPNDHVKFNDPLKTVRFGSIDKLYDEKICYTIYFETIYPISSFEREHSRYESLHELSNHEYKIIKIVENK